MTHNGNRALRVPNKAILFVPSNQALGSQREKALWCAACFLTMTSIDRRKNGAQSMNADDGDGWRMGANRMPTRPDAFLEWIDRFSVIQLPVKTSPTTDKANRQRNPRLIASFVLNCDRPSLPKKLEGRQRRREKHPRQRSPRSAHTHAEHTSRATRLDVACASWRLSGAFD